MAAALAAAGCVAVWTAMAGAGVAAGSTGAPVAGPVTGASTAASVMRGPRPGGPTSARMAAARIAGAGAATARPPARAGRNTFAVPGGPFFLASNPRTKTLYVVTGGTISVVSTARCNRTTLSGCQAKVAVPGAGFQPVTVDPATDTLYAPFGGTTGTGDTVEVFNGATCNASDTSGCQPVATVRVGRFPIAASLDPATHTLYVSNNYSSTVSMINTATCNAARTAGCAGPVPAVKVGAGPNLSAVAPATHTLYVPNDGPGGTGGNTGSNGTTVSLINTATCNAVSQGGCPTTRAPTATVGNSPFGVNIAAGTAYVWNTGSDTVFSNTASMVNTATCNAVRRTSCHPAQPTATVGVGPGPGATDPRTHSVYAVNIDDDTLSVLNSATCNARHPAGCPPVAPTRATGANPQDVLVDGATGTVYVANVIDNTVSVFDGGTCNATNHTGCRQVPPAIPLNGAAPGTADVDTATHTLYLANQLTGQVMLASTATCNAHDAGGCHIVATVRTGTPGVTGSDTVTVAVNQATDTVYAVNAGEGMNSTVKVINGAACNATHTSGCGQAPATIHVGVFPVGIAIDQATDTVYVANTGGSTISVINGATCNGTNHSGCGHTPAALSATGTGFGLAVNQDTDTLYAVAANDTLAVFNGATCNAADTSGCGQAPVSVAVGSFPEGVAVDQANDTVYVANNANSDAPASVSVINGATCNGTVQSGCGQTPATAPAGRGAFGLAVDQAAGKVVVAGVSDSSVTLINVATCNATNTSGCGRTPAKKPTGSGPFWVAVGSGSGTAYVSNFNSFDVSVVSVGG
jgi:DNA-binding beta-propeller fold protein YncE